MAFFTACLIVGLYGYLKTSEGIRYAEPSDALRAVPSLLAFYGSYVTAILGFWFFRPWPRWAHRHAAWIPYALAIVTSVGLNAFLLFGVAQGYWLTTYFESVDQVVSVTLGVALKLSLVTAPANIYYFGQPGE